MSRLKKLQEKQRKISRFQVLKSIFSSLFITVAVVVVAVIAIPTSPKGSIESIQSFSNIVVYTASITDEDSAIIDDTLIIVIENQFDKLTEKLKLGDNTGSFEGLKENTEYTVKILADKGFGFEVLDSKRIFTKAKTGGAITYKKLNNEVTDQILNYSIGYYINDPFNDYKSIQIRYGYKYPSEDQVLNFTIISLSKFASSTIIDNIYNNNLEVQIYLEAINQKDEVVELDSLIFNTPFQIYASFWVTQVSNNEIVVSVYPDMYENADIKYQVILKRNYVELDRKNVELTNNFDSQHFEEEEEISFTNLKPETDYTVILQVEYVDPYTKVLTNKTLNTVIITTLSDFSYTITVNEFPDYYEVLITLDDPNDNYNIGYYTLYEVTDIGNVYQNYLEFNYQMVDGLKQFSFNISKVLQTNYLIEIGIKDVNIYTNFNILKTIEVIEGVK